MKDATARVIERHIVRGVLLAPGARVLLMQMAFPWYARPVWIAPGGGLEVGEAAEDGLQRELREETGRTLAVGSEVWQTRFSIGYEGRTVHARERYFLVRTERFEARPSALEPHERSWLRGFRWWPAGELTSRANDLSPPGLAAQLSRLAGGQGQRGSVRS